MPIYMCTYFVYRRLELMAAYYVKYPDQDKSRPVQDTVSFFHFFYVSLFFQENPSYSCVVTLVKVEKAKDLTMADLSTGLSAMKAGLKGWLGRIKKP